MLIHESNINYEYIFYLLHTFKSLPCNIKILSLNQLLLFVVLHVTFYLFFKEWKTLSLNYLVLGVKSWTNCLCQSQYPGISAQTCSFSPKVISMLGNGQLLIKLTIYNLQLKINSYIYIFLKLNAYLKYVCLMVFCLLQIFFIFEFKE